MPKLRIRTLDGTTHRVAVDQDCTFDRLRRIVAETVVSSSADVEQVELSLNKRDTISAAPDAQLSSLDIRSGDLLWVLRPATTTTSASTDKSASHLGGCSSSPLGARAAAPAESTPAANAALEQQQQQQGVAVQTGESHAVQHVSAAPEEQQRGAAEAEAEAMEIDADELHQEVRAMEQEEQRRRDGAGHEEASSAGAVSSSGSGGRPGQSVPRVPAGLSLPAYLDRVLSSNGCGLSGAGQPPLQQQERLPLLCAVHACMLESGFVPLWSLKAAPGCQQQQQYALPPGAGASSVTRLQYLLDCCRPAAPAPCTGEASPSAAAAAAAAATCPTAQLQLQRQAPPQGSVEVVCSTMGGFLSAFGSAAPAAAPPTDSAGDGGGGDGGGSGDGGGGGSQRQPQRQETAPPSVVRRLDLRMSDHAEIVATGDSGARVVLRDVRGLWRKLKDCVAFPLSADAARRAGVEPPLPGLLQLPGELLDTVLRALGPVPADLARASCACATLHHAATDDSLWEPLYEREFGGRPVGTAGGRAPPGGWAAAFARAWRAREELRHRRRQRMHVSPLYRRPPSFPPNPWAPAPFPVHVVGGDSDRLPMLGGGPGDYRSGPFGMTGGDMARGPGGRGMMPFGGGGGAGAPFGGGAGAPFGSGGGRGSGRRGFRLI